MALFVHELSQLNKYFKKQRIGQCEKAEQGGLTGVSFLILDGPCFLTVFWIWMLNIMITVRDPEKTWS
jgi:hypothetical protein